MASLGRSYKNMANKKISIPVPKSKTRIHLTATMRPLLKDLDKALSPEDALIGYVDVKLTGRMKMSELALLVAAVNKIAKVPRGK